MSTPNPALEAFLRSIPLFSYLEQGDLMDLLRLLRPVELEVGHVLFKQGDAGNAMWVLGKGTEVSVSVTQPDARPVVVAYAKQGETVGEMALVDDAPRSGTAVVMQGGSAHQIDAADFQAVREARVPAAYKVLRRICVDLCARLRHTTDRIVPPSQGVISSPGVPASVRATPADVDAFAPFRPLPNVVKLALSQKLSVVDVASVFPVFGEGERADAAYFVVSGEVSVGRNGKTLATLGPGAMFGLIACIDQGARSASCVTTGPARLLRLSDRDFDALFATSNRFAFELVELVARQLVQHLRDANARLPRLGSPPAPRPRAAAPEVIQLLEAEVLPLELEMELA